MEHDTEYLNQLVDLATTIRTQVTDAVRRGLSPEETRKAVNIDSFVQRMTGDSPDRRREFDYDFIAPGIARAYEEAKLEAEQ